MTDSNQPSSDGVHERPWLEYRTTGDGPWLDREFDTIHQADAWGHEHLGVDVADVSQTHPPNSVPAEWAAAGYTSPDAVAEWTSIGIDTPVLAQEWVDAGFTPESASAWAEIEDMTPSEAMAAVNAGVAPVDIERIRRADPDWTRPICDQVADPDMGICL